MDELVLMDDEMMDLPPEDLPRRVLSDFAVYNSEGFCSSLELLPMWSGVDPDVDLYASGNVLDDDGEWAGGQALNTGKRPLVVMDVTSLVRSLNYALCHRQATCSRSQLHICMKLRAPSTRPRSGCKHGISNRSITHQVLVNSLSLSCRWYWGCSSSRRVIQWGRRTFRE